MPEPAEMAEKMKLLEQQDYVMIVNLINQLIQKTENVDDLSLFREIRERTSRKPLTENEVDDVVAAARRERHAHSN